jgi:RNA polymerase sigma factor (sigma-70 family)
MKTQNSTSEFPNTKAIREKIFKIPLLPQDKALDKFKEMDALLYPHALKLTKNFPRLRDYFQEVMFRVASGNTLGKNYYDKEDHEDDKKNKKILKNSEKRVLAHSFAMLRLKDKPQRFCDLVEQAGFLRGVFEEAVETFLEIAKEYPEALANSRKAAAANHTDFIKLERQVQSIENELQYFHPDELSRYVVEAKQVWRQYVTLREELIAPYFRLVYTIAKKSTMSQDQTLDNFQNGVFGLVRAVKCYTPKRFAAFSVVARSWIKQSILLNLKSEVNLIKLPVALWHVFQKLEKVRTEIEQKTQQDATYEQIAKSSGIALEKVQKIYENAKLVQVLSLNTPTHNEDDQNKQAGWNMESIQATEPIHETFELKSEYRLIEQVVHLMDEEERTIFGLVSGCFDLIPTIHLEPADILKETIRQKAAKKSLGVIFT